jgi:hypothetical protein
MAHDITSPSRPGPRYPAPSGDILGSVRSALSRAFALCLILACVAAAHAQLVVPRFGTRGQVDEALLTDFMRLLRSEIGRQTGFILSDGDLVTAGLAGSLDPEFAYYIAQLYDMRYAISGEVAQVTAGGVQAPYTVTVLVADRDEQRSTDLLTETFNPANLQDVASRLAAHVARFVSPSTLEAGSAALFVSSTPGEATVFVNGVEVGRTSAMDVLMLKPGTYSLELRREGFLPASRTVTLRAGATEFVNVAMTALAGGSIQVVSTPPAQIYLDGVLMGETPMTVAASPGTRILTLQRPGFETSSQSVQVQNYRVSRVDKTLTPVFRHMLFWRPPPGSLVYIDGVLRSGTFLGNPGAGEHRIEVRRTGGGQSFTVTVPDTGVFELDFENERLRPFASP